MDISGYRIYKTLPVHWFKSKLLLSANAVVAGHVSLASTGRLSNSPENDSIFYQPLQAVASSLMQRRVKRKLQSMHARQRLSLTRPIP